MSDEEEVTAICWSFSLDGQRCMRPAGHDGDHEVMTYTAWTDAEAWTPNLMMAEARRIAQADIARIVDENVERVVEPVTYDDDIVMGPGVEVEEGCFNCGHPRHDQDCEVTVGRGARAQECGCKFRYP